MDADAETRLTKAQAFIAENVGTPLPENRTAVAVEDILRANPEAWKAWFMSGSREDWSERIGVLDTPALVLSGSKDRDLGPEAQAALMRPHLRHVHSDALLGAKHLIPLERPQAVADGIRRLMDAVGRG